jgi:DNA-binding NarL/FixJ family response regulator
MGRPALADPGAGAGKGLTPREAEVLQLLAEGQTNRAIAQSLRISEHTVKFHVTAILGKLGAESRTEAVVQAARAGWIVL